MVMVLMTAVLVDIQLRFVKDVKTDIMKDGMTHQKTIDEIVTLLIGKDNNWIIFYFSLFLTCNKTTTNWIPHP